MRRTHVAQLRAAASQFAANYSSSVTSSPLTVAAEVAEAISLRNSRLTKLPSDVAAAIDAAAADANRKAIQSKGRELTDELKRLSRTKHRGGKYPNLHDAPPDYSIARTLRGKRRQKENKALTELAQQHTPLAIDEHEPLPDSFWDGEERGVTKLLNAITTEAKDSAAANAAAGGAMYREDTAAAYAVTRFPACYAALRRVLLEVQRRTPRGWRPDSVLDFGAGPGTATWAAHSIWSSPEVEPLKVTAVEPSGAMAWLGQDIQQRLEEAYQKATTKTVASALSEREAEENSLMTAEDKELNIDTSTSSKATPTLPPPPPMVRWMSRLSGTRGRGRGNQKERRDSPQSGRKYDLVIAGYVLSEIATPKDRRKLISDLWNRTGKYLILVEPGTPVGSEMIQSARSQILDLPQNLISTFPAGGEAAATAAAAHVQAHVVAPCPHDGPCPLQGRASWCHFVQRFERTAVQRRAKIVPGKLPPRSHQDERFSYVILARGPRDQGNYDEELKGSISSVFTDQVHVSGIYNELEKELLGEESKQAVDDGNEYLYIPENLKPKRILLDDTITSENEFLEIDEEEESDVEGDSLEATEMELRRLLLDSLDNENESDDDDDYEHENGRQLPPELEEVLQRSLEELRKNNKMVNKSNISEEGPLYESESEEDVDKMSGASTAAAALPKVKGLSGPEAEEAARKSSSAWSRILRPPRKRSGHVVIDLCSAVGADGEVITDSGGGSDENAQRLKGALVRQIVSKGKATREVGGIAPFKLARRAAWGDLWPLDYQRKMKAFEPPQGDAIDGRGGIDSES